MSSRRNWNKVKNRINKRIPDFSKTGPLVFAHRGASAQAPENTMAAFELARRLGAHGIELDVRLCGSGEILVCHDADLVRTGAVGLLLAETPWSDLSTVDVGSWFAPDFASERIPRLSEVFETFGESLYYDIEVKHYGRERGPTEAALVQLIRQHNLAHRAVVSSFDPMILARMRKLAPEIPRSVIYSNNESVPRYLRGGQARLMSGSAMIKPSFGLVNRNLMRANRLRGGYVLPWTVDDPEVARDLVAQGCGGVITNEPARILGALAQTPHEALAEGAPDSSK